MSERLDRKKGMRKIGKENGAERDDYTSTAGAMFHYGCVCVHEEYAVGTGAYSSNVVLTIKRDSSIFWATYNCN